TRSPMRMTDPLPNCFSIWVRAADRARFLFSSMVGSSVGFCRVRGKPRGPPSQKLRLASPSRYREMPRSTVRPHEAAVQALDGEVLARLDLDGCVVGIARQQPDPVLADLQQLDRYFLVDARYHDLPGTRVAGPVHTDQVAVEDALVP